MEYKIRRAVPADEQRIRELCIEMLNAIYHTQDVKGYETGYRGLMIDTRPGNLGYRVFYCH